MSEYQEALEMQKDFVLKLTQRMVDASRELIGHHIPMPKTRFTTYNVSSTGGRRGDQGCMKLRVYPRDYRTEFKEYDHIKDDPEIGNLKLDAPNWKHLLAAIVAHEFAHVADHLLRYRGKNVSIPSVHKSYDPSIIARAQRDGHGAQWQYFYRLFRNEFVNNLSFSNITYEKKIPRTYTRKTDVIGVVTLRRYLYNGYWYSPDHKREYQVVKGYTRFKKKDDGFITIRNSIGKVMRYTVEPEDIRWISRV